MCLIAFAWGASERFPFAIAANRDEFLERPTAPLSLWQSPGGAGVLGGRDLKDGGTWMGFSPNGRFAMLTNVRDPLATPPAQPISRGGLPLAWLESHLSAQAWAQQINPHSYQGFNLIVGDWLSQQCHYFTNQAISKPFGQPARMQTHSDATELVAFSMPLGSVYGLSNAVLDTDWPKTQRLKAHLQTSLAHDDSDADTFIASNLQALQQRDQLADAQLPSTGVPLELERALSRVFVSHPEAAPHYGTRSSLVAVFGAGVGLKIKELTHTHDPRHAQGLSQARSAQLSWPAA